MKIPPVALLVLAGGLLAVASKPRRRPVQAQRIVRISRVVGDLERAEAFYRDGVGFETVSRGQSDKAALLAFGLEDTEAEEVVMRLGTATIALVRFATPGRPYPSGSRSDDLWFQHLAIVVNDMDAAYVHLVQTPGWISISEGGPQLLPPSNGNVRAFKFRDPDGHPLELIWFPPGSQQAFRVIAGAGRAPGTSCGGGHTTVADDRPKSGHDTQGDLNTIIPPAPEQRGVSGALFLDVDHSALSIASPPRSLNFYRALGFRVSDRSVNRGLAQDRLDGLSGARVRVTGLRPASEIGPGLELLGYRLPGRSADMTRPNDVATDWVTIEVTTLFGEPRRAMRDPDGHLLMLVDQGSGLPA